MASKQLLLAVLAVAGLHAHAQTVGDLSRIQAETLIIKAQANRASAQAELNRNRGTIGMSGGGDDAPMVRAVTLTGGVRLATFVYPDATQTEARVGSVLPNGFKVESITVDKVVLSKGSRKTEASFVVGGSMPMPVAASAPGTPGMAGLPR